MVEAAALFCSSGAFAMSHSTAVGVGAAGDEAPSNAERMPK